MPTTARCVGHFRSSNQDLGFLLGGVWWGAPLGNFTIPPHLEASLPPGAETIPPHSCPLNCPKKEMFSVSPASRKRHPISDERSRQAPHGGAPGVDPARVLYVLACRNFCWHHTRRGGSGARRALPPGTSAGAVVAGGQLKMSRAFDRYVLGVNISARPDPYPPTVTGASPAATCPYPPTVSEGTPPYPTKHQAAEIPNPERRRRLAASSPQIGTLT